MKECRTAHVISGKYKGEIVFVEGTDVQLWGKEWNLMESNPAAIKYLVRSTEDNLPESGTVYGVKRAGNLSELFHESELQFKDNETSLLSTGHPNTLKSWYELSSIFFGKDSEATKFIEDKIREQGEEEEVIVGEPQLLHILMTLAVSKPNNVKVNQ